MLLVAINVTIAYDTRLGSRTEFAIWLCRQHNRVNEKLGKNTFPCDLPAIDRRWKYGGPECWSAEYDGYAHETLGQDIDEDDED